MQVLSLRDRTSVNKNQMRPKPIIARATKFSTKLVSSCSEKGKIAAMYRLITRVSFYVKTTESRFL